MPRRRQDGDCRELEVIRVQTIRPLSFEEILDALQLDFGEGGDGVGAGAHAMSAPGGDWLFQLFSDQIEPVPDASAGTTKGFEAQAYREAADTAFAAAPVISEEDRVIAELELDAAVTAGDLKRIRRAFALHNHPDLLDPALCAQATSRMKIANMLIDRRRKELELRR